MEASYVIINRMIEIVESILFHIPSVLAAFVVLILTFISSKISTRLIGNYLQRLEISSALTEITKKLIRASMWIAGIALATIIVFPSITPSSVFGALGLSSIAIGFAFKDIFENFLAGLLILIEEPFILGDLIECQSIRGHVEKINIRCTIIRRLDGEEIVVPNAVLFKNAVTVIANIKYRKTSIRCELDFAHDIGFVKQLIHNTVKKTETVNSELRIDIFATSFSDNGITYEIIWWTKPLDRDLRVSQHNVIESLKKAFDAEDITPTTPSRLLFFHQPLTIQNK